MDSKVGTRVSMQFCMCPILRTCTCKACYQTANDLYTKLNTCCIVAHIKKTLESLEFLVIDFLPYMHNIYIYTILPFPVIKCLYVKKIRIIDL